MMKKMLMLVFVLSTGTMFAQEYEIDTKDAKVSFEYVSEDTKGTITGITAKINLNLADSVSTASIEGEADVNTLSTGNSSRDKHLKSDDFFDVAKYPTMTFTCSEIVFEKDEYYAKGTLQIKDVKKDVKFMIKTNEKEMIFYATIYSADYGVAVKKDRKTSKVRVKVIVPIG